jgi:hypothetical protein
MVGCVNELGDRGQDDDELGDIDIGHRVYITNLWRDGKRVGLIETHDRPDGGGRCSGSVMFDLPAVRESFPGHAVWTVESWAPLTLSPSLLCRTCGHHGFIRAGSWVPA